MLQLDHFGKASPESRSRISIASVWPARSLPHRLAAGPNANGTPDGNFPPYKFAQNTSPNNDDHIREDTPAPFVQMDFATTFDGMPFKALVGMRYEKSTVIAQSLQKVPVSVSWNNPTEFFTQYAANATYSDVRSSYREFLPNIDLSLEVEPAWCCVARQQDHCPLRSSFDDRTTSVTSTPKPGSRTATEGNRASCPTSRTTSIWGRSGTTPRAATSRPIGSPST